MAKKLYVGNLSYTVTDQDLTDLFSQCGTVESAKVISDRQTGRSKGFGFVEMASDDEAAQAIEKFNGTDHQGRPLKVNEARPMTPRRRWWRSRRRLRWKPKTILNSTLPCRIYPEPKGREDLLAYIWTTVAFCAAVALRV